MNLIEEMNDNQFLKNNFADNVKEYLTLEEQITKLNQALRDRRKKMKELSDGIMKTMNENDIHHVNIRNGVLVYNSKETFKSLTKKTLENGLTIYFNNDVDRAKDASSTVLDNREKVTKNTLKLKRF
jgi:ferritin-like metal-binding protein YciE